MGSRGGGVNADGSHLDVQLLVLSNVLYSRSDLIY